MKKKSWAEVEKEVRADIEKTMKALVAAGAMLETQPGLYNYCDGSPTTLAGWLEAGERGRRIMEGK